MGGDDISTKKVVISRKAELSAELVNEMGSGEREPLTHTVKEKWGVGRTALTDRAQLLPRAHTKKEKWGVAGKEYRHPKDMKSFWCASSMGFGVLIEERSRDRKELATS